LGKQSRFHRHGALRLFGQNLLDVVHARAKGCELAAIEVHPAVGDVQL
jgi:hypothetical protein